MYIVSPVINATPLPTGINLINTAAYTYGFILVIKARDGFSLTTNYVENTGNCGTVLCSVIWATLLHQGRIQDPTIGGRANRPGCGGAVGVHLRIHDKFLF
jgi:hypothetical protein